MENNKENEKDEKLSRTDYDQKMTEKSVLKIYKKANLKLNEEEKYNGTEADYLRDLHYEYINRHINTLPYYYKSSDTGMPWFPYWTINVIEMTKKEEDLDLNTKLEIVKFLKLCQHPEGGFCGWPRGLAHTVSNYAAIMAIVNLGIEEAYDIIDIPKMKQFLLKMKNRNFQINNQPSYVDKNGDYLITRSDANKCGDISSTYPGAFASHTNGESDLRATYCSLVVASTLDILDDDLTEGVVDLIKQCQTYEGGFGPEPFCEAHGGYSYCAIATLVLLNKLNEINVGAFLRWLTNRQMYKEGGFNGRTNKLVDSCYSFWQGSIFNMLFMGDNTLTIDQELLYDQLALQAYILVACQNRVSGGLYDKPGKPPDIFHTNYATAGLCCSEFSLIKNYAVSLSENIDNELRKINPIYGANEEKVLKAKLYFKNKNK